MSGLELVLSSITAALLGGWYCGGMCGPIAALATHPRASAFHQFGRLLAYLTLGVVASLFGQKVLGWIPEDKKFVVSLLILFLSLWILASIWKSSTLVRLQKVIWRNRNKVPWVNEYFALGLLNGLIPCSWLYGFVVVAGGLGNAVASSLIMFSLWLGSLPWLLSFSWLGEKIRRFGRPSPWFERALLAGLAISLLAHHIQ